MYEFQAADLENVNLIWFPQQKFFKNLSVLCLLDCYDWSVQI